MGLLMVRSHTAMRPKEAVYHPANVIGDVDGGSGRFDVVHSRAAGAGSERLKVV
jgi:hypothetical protein